MSVDLWKPSICTVLRKGVQALNITACEQIIFGNAALPYWMVASCIETGRAKDKCCCRWAYVLSLVPVNMLQLIQTSQVPSFSQQMCKTLDWFYCPDFWRLVSRTYHSQRKTSFARGPWFASVCPHLLTGQRQSSNFTLFDLLMQAYLPPK